MDNVSPKRLERAMSIAQQMLAEHEEIPQQADVWGIIDNMAERYVQIRLYLEGAAERTRRLEKTADQLRTDLKRILEALELDYLERPLHTLTIAAGTPSAIVTDEQRLPRLFFAQPKPDIRKIVGALKSGADVPGAELTNPQPVLRILSR